jgi:hypothetical protein
MIQLNNKGAATTKFSYKEGKIKRQAIHQFCLISASIIRLSAFIPIYSGAYPGISTKYDDFS